MRNLRQGISALALVLASSTALAIPVGTWDATDATSTHGLWFNSKIFVNGSGDNTFNIQDKATFSVNGDGTAALSGSAYSTKLGGGFEFNVGFNWLCDGSSVQANTCGSVTGDQTDFGGVDVPLAQQESWNYFEMDDNQLLTGSGSLSGLDFKISQKPSDGSKPFRIGLGANWFDTSEFGGSGWFNIDEIVLAADADGTIGTRASAGDFNVDLAKVPEPSTLLLLGGGLIGLSIGRRKSKTHAVR